VEFLKGHDDAMALSGLIFSGGNAAWRGKDLPEGVMGGVLTGATIAQLNLRGTDLLFLNACQTGNGKDNSPEGIYGLQRAFKKAGVNTIVMYLWNVDDYVAKEFAIKFYDELTHNQWDKRAAFEKAKTFIRDKEEYKEPYYWAGIVMLD
jgi:CHAT domain-containing protein